jgi:hypothetical protein
MIIRRINDSTLIVGGQVCVNIHGIYYPQDQSPLGAQKINAIWDYLDDEKKALKQNAVIRVRELLIECNIKYIK